MLKKAVVEANEKLDKVAEDIAEIKLIQASQAADLKHHIYRTDLAEENLRILQEKMEPVEKHVERVNGAFRVIGMAATGLGLIIGAAKVILELF